MRGAVTGLLVALCLAPAGALATPEETDVGAIIERCWTASEEDLNSDSTLRIGHGVAAVVACLEDEIVRMVEASPECAPWCGGAYNNAGGFELAKRLEGILRDLAAEHRQ